MKKYSITLISIIFFISYQFSALQGIALSPDARSDYNVKNIEDENNNQIGKDTVDVAFRKTEMVRSVGAISNLNAQEVLKYDNAIWASDVLTGRTLGMLGSNNIRGLGVNINTADLTGSGLNSGNALFIVDGLPRDIAGLRLSEIEDITVLKDVNAAVLYGSAAINGVILITTKRGKAFDKQTNFSAKYSMSRPLRFPKYLKSAEYMTLFNEARKNDGLTPTFSDEMIENYKSGKNPYRYPDVDYYSDEYLNSFRPSFDVAGDFSGGNETAKYFLGLGWNSTGSLLKIGEAANAKNNIFNVRGNVDLKIIDWINTAVDATAIFAENKGPRGNFWNDAATVRPYEYTPLIPMDLIDPDNSLLKGRKNDVDGKYLIGGNINKQSTAIGDAYAGGVSESVWRIFSFNNRVNFDLKSLTEGLSFHTNISFDYLTGFNQVIANQYSVYEAVWNDAGDKIIDLKQYGKDARPGSQDVQGTYFERKLGFYGLLSYDRIFDEIHHFTGNLLAYASEYKRSGFFQSIKQAHLGLQIGYAYNNKYLADFSSAYVNSTKLPSGNRLGFSPSVGLGWIASSEDFLSGVDKLDYLKFRLSGGIINSDISIGGTSFSGGFFYYDNRYANSGSYNWYEGTRSRSGVMSSWGVNEKLGFIKRKEINLGFESLFFDRMIGLEGDLFYNIYSDLVIIPYSKYPNYYNDFAPYENFEKDRYKGAEIGVSFNKAVGDWDFYLKASMLYSSSERTIVSEIYEDEYQYRKGYSKDATFGLEALGFFKDQADIDNSPTQMFGSVKPGDIKYKDQNGDGSIDSRDEVFLRRWQAPLSGGLEIKVSYKNWILYMLGEGRSGAKNFKEHASYYWADGNDKYSEEVLNRWTPETASTATFPRLSSQTNSNNSRRSSFWMYKDDYFQVRKIQLTYQLPEKITKHLSMNRFDIFADASNVFQFAANKKIRETYIGGQPYSRTFSVGLNINF